MYGFLTRCGVTRMTAAAGKTAQIKTFLTAQFRARPGTVAFYVCLITMCGIFGISAIPGMRHVPAHGTGFNPILDGVLSNLAYALTPVLCLIRTRKSFTYRRSWRVLTIGLALYGIGNIYWTLFVPPLGVKQPMPSVADAFWLAFYVCAFIALVLVVREVADRLSLSLWLDGIVGGLAVAAIAAASAGDVLRGSNAAGHSILAVIAAEAYPLLDVLLLLVVTALLALYHWRPPAGLWFLAGGLGLFAIADVLHPFLNTQHGYRTGSLADFVGVLATLLIGMAPGWSRKPAGTSLPQWLVLGVPVASTLCAVALLSYDHLRHFHPVAVVLAAATVIAAASTTATG